jgi:hypothetical protein
MKRLTRIGRVGLLAGLLVAAACSYVEAPPPVGEIGLSSYDPTSLGYERSELFLVGGAQRYLPVGTFSHSGQWTVTEQPLTGEGAFRTRMVVYRPSDPEDFNGTVIVEWMNVTAGADLPNDWLMSHTELVRSGYAYVGVSAQAVGVNQLRSSQPARYGGLVHPGDSFSYDIFSEAGQNIRQNPRVLDGLVPERLIATGESQSAGRLVTYINAVHPVADVYDGFMVHSRGSGGAPLSQSPQTAVPVPSPSLIRLDVDVPVMVVQAEGDVISANLNTRQPDMGNFRLWELAGTSHADAYMIGVAATDNGDGTGAQRMFDYMRTPINAGCTSPINAGAHHWHMNAAFDALNTWVRDGDAPPPAPWLQVVSTSPTVLARDAQGNALGGVRSPHVDAPVATLDSENGGPVFCRLFGRTIPLTPTQLAALYPTHTAFVAAWSAALDDAVEAGHILAADAPELLAAAQASTVPAAP